MLKIERHQEILKILNEVHISSIKDIAKKIFSSEATVRRDIETLESRGLVHKTYGAVVLSEYANDVVPYTIRDTTNSVIKEKLAKRAAKLINDGDVIFMDNSSTVKRMIKYINGVTNIKIISNSLSLFSEVQGNKNITFYSTGGKFNTHNDVLVGSSTEEFIRTLNADVLFFSAQALSFDGEVSDVSEDETPIRKVMIERAKKKVFLVDSSKLGLKKLYKVCDRNDIDEIISPQESILSVSLMETLLHNKERLSVE